MESLVWVASNGRHVKMPRLARDIIEATKSDVDLYVLSEQLAERYGSRLDPAELRATSERLSARVRVIESQEAAGSERFWPRVPLLPTGAVRSIAALGQFAFRPAAIVGLAAVIAAGIFLAFQRPRPSYGDLAGQWWLVYALFLVSLAAHELGHASACARFGVLPSSIGFTVYGVLPAFYSDVSSAWVLRRWERVVVNCGGIYFQIACGAVLGIGYYLTGWPPAHACLAAIIVSCLLSLNPVLRFDGYWILSDALDLPNLIALRTEVVRRVIRRLRRDSRKVQLGWSPGVTWFLRIYTAASLAMLILVVAFGLPRLPGTIALVPKDIAQLVHAFRGDPGYFSVAGSLARLTFDSLLWTLLAVGIARAVIQPLRRRLRGQARLGPSHAGGNS